MSNPTNREQRAQQRAARLDWLRTNPALLAKLPGATGVVMDGTAEAEALEFALRRMRHKGLYASTSASERTRRGIRLLVSELRGEPLPAPRRSPQVRKDAGA